MTVFATSHLKRNKDKSLKEEEMSLDFLKNQLPHFVPDYPEHREKGRKGILYKLADSILRENMEDFYQKAVNVKKKGSTLYLNDSAYPFVGIYKPLESLSLRDDLTYKLVKVNAEGAVLFPIKHEYAFQLVETTDDLLYLDGSGTHIISTASELLEILFRKKAYTYIDTFIRELNNGTANLSLASLYFEDWKKRIQEDAKELEASTTFDYLAKKKEENPSFSDSLFFEQLAVEGHHLHPGAKTKLGITFHDVFRYSPEFHQTFPVRFAAVRHKHLLTTEKNAIKKYFPEEWKKSKEMLYKKGWEPETYDVIPLHPWQFEHAVPLIYEQEINRGDVVLLEEPQLEAEATSSFRTVASKRPEDPVFKLAVNSQMTSTVRSISPQTALNSVVVTELLKKIMEKERHLEHFLPLNELAGAAYQSEDELKSRNLTMLLREKIDEYLDEGEVAIAGMALYAESPLQNTTVLKELVDQFAKEHDYPKDEASASFFQKYIETVLPGYLTLMVKYGVALEGHLQNSIPVFKNGQLSHFYFRDWGGSRIYTERLRKQGLSPKFAADSVSVTNKLSDMRNKLYYTVFQNHLGEIIRQLVQYSSLQEKTFWTMVKAVCDKVLESLAKQKDIAGQVEEDRSFLYQSAVMHKSLTKMRLTNSKGYGYNEVFNPLADEKKIVGGKSR